MILFLDVISPKPKFVIIDNNKVVKTLYILDHNETKISDSIHKKILKYQKKNNILNFLDYLVICNGPGSYTSLRVGMSFMLGISYSKKIPIYGLSCIDLLSRSIVEKDFGKTILIISSANNQNFICLPSNKKYYKYDTYNINNEYLFKNVNLNVYSKCISNYTLSTKIKEKILINIEYLEYKKIENNFINYLPIDLKKETFLQPIYISENKLFD
tara:strand:- start:94 stop:735 length:642 start_codon:yes stop_codon:yes gene_type:complete